MIFIYEKQYIKKRGMGECSERVSFSMHCNGRIKIIQALSMV